MLYLSHVVLITYSSDWEMEIATAKQPEFPTRPRHVLVIPKPPASSISVVEPMRNCSIVAIWLKCIKDLYGRLLGLGCPKKTEASAACRKVNNMNFRKKTNGPITQTKS